MKKHFDHEDKKLVILLGQGDFFPKKRGPRLFHLSDLGVIKDHKTLICQIVVDAVGCGKPNELLLSLMLTNSKD